MDFTASFNSFFSKGEEAGLFSLLSDLMVGRSVHSMVWYNSYTNALAFSFALIYVGILIMYTLVPFRNYLVPLLFRICRTRSAKVLLIVIVNVALFCVIELLSYHVLTSVLHKPRYRHSVKPSTNQFHPYLGHIHPEKTQISTSKPYRDLKTSLFTNDEGNSLTPITRTNPILNIAITGGSTMFGVGSTNNSTTMPSLLEHLINEECGISCEVHNLAGRGYQSFQELLKLNRFLATHEVDIVLAVSGRNDASHTHKWTDTESSFLKEHVWKNAVPLVRRAEEGHVLFVNLSNWLRSRFATADLMHRLVFRLSRSPSSSEKQTPGSQYIEERAAISVRHYSMMRELAESVGAEFRMVLQPTAFTKAKLYKQETAYIQAKYKRDESKIQARRSFESEYYTAIRSLPKRFELIDLTASLDDLQTSTYIDICHYNDAGAEHLARSLLAHILPMLKTRFHCKPGNTGTTRGEDGGAQKRPPAYK